MKKIISFMLSIALLISVTAVQVYAATEYTVEAESYSATNWMYIGGKILTSKTGASGGKYISLKMDTNREVDFYTEYTVNVASAGYYKITLYSTPVTRTGWSSPIYVNVNNGNDIALSGEKGTETVAGTAIYENESDVVYLKSGDNTVRFIIKDKNDSGNYACSIDKIKFTTSSYSLSGIYSDNPYMVFESGSNANIYVEGNGIAGADLSVSYTVKTYNNSSVTSGTTTIQNGKKTGLITLSSLNKGSYIVSATYSGKTVTNYFSVVIPTSARSIYAETPFAMDTNISFLYNKYSDNKDFVDNYAKALSLMGVSWIRDRISMQSAVTKNGDVITASATINKYIGKEIKKYSNIKITAVINDLPDWMTGGTHKLKDCDLIDVYKAFKALGDSLGTSVDAIEILNETDNGWDTDDAPNIYAALLKAAAAGINDSECNAMIISQGATGTRALDYTDILYKNDVFKLSSADNYHFHYDFEADDTSAYIPFPGIKPIRQIKAMQKANGENKPIWITEAGILMECDSNTDLSATQQYMQAKYLITSSVESIASGADKNFYFLGTEYQEDEYTTGIMSKNDSYPSFYPAFSAMSAMTYLLGEGQYLGNLNSEYVRAYVFNNGSKKVIVAYSTSGSRTFTPSGTYKKYDMFGNLLSGTSGSFTLTTEPIFIVLDGSVLISNTDNAHSASIVVPAAVTTGDHIIVSQDYSDDASKGVRNSEYYISSSDHTVTVTVANLNNEPVSGIIMPESDADWTFSPASRSFSLSALSSGTYTFEIENHTGDTAIKEGMVSVKAVCDAMYSSISVAKVKSGSNEYMSGSQRFWIDATHYSKKEGAYKQIRDNLAVNRRVMRLNTDGYVEPLVESSLLYDFYISQAGTYDVWMLASDSNANHTTKWKWRYEQPDEYKRYTGTKPAVAYDRGSLHMYWYKVDSNKSFTAGKHTIVIKSDALRGGTYNDYMLHVIDSIVIVPTTDTWWSPASKTNGENVTAFENRSFASNFNFKNLTEDVELPINTATGATVSWTSSNSSVIDSDGKITRASTQGSATLTAKIEYDDSSTTVSIPVTVAAASDIVPKVTLVDGNDKVITEFNGNRDNYLNVSAVNPTGEAKKVDVYVAGYDNETNELKYLKKETVDVAAHSSANPENVLIDDEDASVYKIFAWNSRLTPLLGAATMLTTVKRNDAFITISGNCGTENEKLTLTVVKAGVESLSSMSEENVYKNLCYIGETTTDNKGNYVLRFKLENADGKYKVNIRYSSGSKQSLFTVE